MIGILHLTGKVAYRNVEYGGWMEAATQYRLATFYVCSLCFVQQKSITNTYHASVILLEVLYFVGYFMNKKC